MEDLFSMCQIIIAKTHKSFQADFVYYKNQNLYHTITSYSSFERTNHAKKLLQSYGFLGTRLYYLSNPKLIFDLEAMYQLVQ